MATKLIAVISPLLIAFIFGFELFAGTRTESICPAFLFGAFTCILILPIISIYAIARRRKVGWLGASFAIVGIGWLILSFGPGGDGVIARATSPDGTEMCVIQKFTGTFTEPYSVQFYYRRPAGRWGAFYYEHEDTRWWLGKIKIEPDGRHVTLSRFFRPVASFDSSTESFTLIRWNRTLAPAQGWMPEDWTPEHEVSSRLGQRRAANKL